MTMRKSVPVGAEDTLVLERMHQPESAERRALAELTGASLEPNASDAEILAALLEAGRRAVTERVSATGYAAWAQSMDDEDRAYRRARRGWDRGDR
jgi:hypothetical protein